jgi:hypothetical protein
VISVSPGDGGSDAGATRKSRTPSRCVQGSYAPERWWRGDQPWDRTTFSRASAERYDHTSSLVVEWSRRRESNPRLRVTRAPCLRQHFVDVVQARGFEPRFSGNRPDVLPLDEAWFGPAGWSRTSLVPLKRRVHGRSATTGYDEIEVGCRAGIRTRIFPVNSRTCCRCHHPTNGRVGRTRTSTHLRPRQVGYRLPYDPKTELG